MLHKHICDAALLTIITSCATSMGWKAIPASQAVYSKSDLRRDIEGIPMALFMSRFKQDETQSRHRLHSVYKYGNCEPDVINKKFLRSTTNMTFNAWEDTKLDYIYLLENMHTQRWRLQCIVMKLFTNYRYLMHKTTHPVWYCQGQVYLLVGNTVQKIAIHEFYMHRIMFFPFNIVFEFYQPPVYVSYFPTKEIY